MLNIKFLGQKLRPVQCRESTHRRSVKLDYFIWNGGIITAYMYKFSCGTNFHVFHAEKITHKLVPHTIW